MGQVLHGSATHHCPAVVCPSQTMRGDARGPSSHTAIESFERGVEPAAWHQRQDRCQVAQAGVRARCSNGTESGSLNGSRP